MLVNAYGFLMNGRDNPSDPRYVKKACDVVVAGNYTYMRFSTDEKGPIQRIDKSVTGTTSIRWAWGNWADRATLTYNSDLNTMLNVTTL